MLQFWSIIINMRYIRMPASLSGEKLLHTSKQSFLALGMRSLILPMEIIYPIPGIVEIMRCSLLDIGSESCHHILRPHVLI